MFSKFVYTSSFSSFYTFYLIDHFQVPVKDAQIYLFVYLGAFAMGTFAGGPIGDRIGRKPLIIGVYLGGAVAFVIFLAAGMSMFWLWVGIVLMGLFSFAESPQLQALLADIAPPATRDESQVVGRGMVRIPMPDVSSRTPRARETTRAGRDPRVPTARASTPGASSSTVPRAMLSHPRRRVRRRARNVSAALVEAAGESSIDCR
jgi:hypothetical protein